MTAPLLIALATALLALALAELLIVLIAVYLVSALAARLGALTHSGAHAATIVGTLVFLAGGVRWAMIMLLFFVSGSVLSRLPTSRHDPITEKSGARDAAQVFANGGIPALLALASLLHPLEVWPTLFAGALSAATADTWATEIGSRFAASPLLLTTLKPVPPGTSGGISLAGTVGALLGTIAIGVAALLVTPSFAGFAAVIVAGFGGSLIDSLLGATVQEVRYCPICDAQTEQRVHHRCGTQTMHLGGIPGLDNDAVNFLATGSGALLALAAASL